MGEVWWALRNACAASESVPHALDCPTVSGTNNCLKWKARDHVTPKTERPSDGNKIWRPELESLSIMKGQNFIR
jgi:hypothetical protein